MPNTPVYRSGQGETMLDILLKLMKAEAELRNALH